MNLQPLLEHLESQRMGVIGETLFRDMMPHQVKDGVLLLAMTPVPKNPYALGYRKGSFQAIVRASEETPELMSVYDKARDLANGVSDAMTLNGVTLGGMKFRFIRPREEPLIFPKSDAALVEASVNFDFVYSV